MLVSLVNDLDELGGPTVLALDDVSALASWPLGLGTVTTLADPHVRKVWGQRQNRSELRLRMFCGRLFPG